MNRDKTILRLLGVKSGFFHHIITNKNLSFFSLNWKTGSYLTVYRRVRFTLLVTKLKITKRTKNGS